MSSRRLWVVHILFLHAPHVVTISLILLSLISHLLSHTHLLPHCISFRHCIFLRLPHLLCHHHHLQPLCYHYYLLITLLLTCYLSHPGILNPRSLMQGVKSLKTLYTLMLPLQIAYLLRIHPMQFIIDSTFLLPFTHTWSIVPWWQSVVHMHPTPKPPMLPALCTSPNFVTGGVSLKKRECPLLILYFVLSLGSTKVDKLGILYAPGYPESMHGMLSIMPLGLEAANGFNWPRCLRTRRGQNINVLSVPPSPLSTFWLFTVLLTSRLLSMQRSGPLHSAHFLAADG